MMTLFEGDGDGIGWIANGIVLPTLIVIAIFWLKRKELELKSINAKDIFAAIIYIALLFAIVSMSGYFLEGIHIFLIFSFPGLTGLWLSTKLSPHTWKFFAANIILSFISLILFGILALGFASQ